MANDLIVKPGHAGIAAAMAAPTRPSLIAGEDADAHDAFCARFIDSLKPADALEEGWVEDISELMWEVRRLRRSRPA